MNDFVLMLAAIAAGSALSLASGALIFLTKRSRARALLIALPFGAGALLAAAFFDLLPESFEHADPSRMLLWALGGFLAFFLLERSANWFHHHHAHEQPHGKSERQNGLLVIGDFLHNAIDGVAIGAAFAVNPMTGLVTVLAVSAHEVPKELGTFGILLSRGWRDKKVLLANALTALGTFAAAIIVYYFGSSAGLPLAEILALTAGFFIYVAASDIIPDIHEKPRREGNFQAVMLLVGIVVIGALVSLLPHAPHH